MAKGSKRILRRVLLCVFLISPAFEEPLRMILEILICSSDLYEDHLKDRPSQRFIV